MSDLETLNLTPSPRVLRMLGRIDFKPWQCLAELVDNAVDAFLNADRDSADSGNSALFPQVNIELSAATEIRAGKGELRVIDNGPGMSPEFLQNAVRAGYSSNDAGVDKLGLFGMGFNVATARVGNRTEVWTTRADDDYWHGVRIDFDEMEQAGSFAAPSLRRPKTSAESGHHGTQIIVSKLDRERAQYLRSSGGLRSTRARLSRVYNKIMRELGLEIVLVGTPLASREFCVWGDERYVETKGDVGRVPARIRIDKDLGSRNYCEDCWQWLDEVDLGTCPVCNKGDRVRMRARRVTGWIGVQRFFDHSDYGVDLVRNGRVIEERSKVFFYWRNPETDEQRVEYPLEQTHWGGRIVGELNIDFVPLSSHQKDAFDQTTREWRLVEEVVRGKGPIVQKYRAQAGFVDRNLSPMARLHAGYRRGQPAGLRTLVPGDDNGKGFNVPAQQWAALFWEGDPDYQSDAKWYEAVLIAEAANSRRKGADLGDLSGSDAFPIAGMTHDDGDPLDDDDPPAGRLEDAVDVAQPTLEEVAYLSRTYELPELPGAPRLEVTAQRLLNGKLDQHRQIKFSAIGNRVEFTYDPRHAVFVESLLEPVDCLIDELGYAFLSRTPATQAEFPLSILTQSVRNRYFPETVNSYAAVRDEAQSLLDELVEFFTETLMGLPGQHSENVSSDERARISQAVALQDHQGAERVDEVIATGEYPRYLGPTCLPKLTRLWPELILDGSFFVNSYSDVDERSQPRVLDDVVTPLRDVLWVANPDGAQSGSKEWRTLLGRAVNSLRLLQGWKVE